MFPLDRATASLSRLVSGVRADQLDHPTPCSEWSVADLLAHTHQFATVFTQNARQEDVDPPSGLVDDWQTAIPHQLDALATAWSDPAAWDGQVSAGGIEMPAADNAVVAIEELSVHAWDLARATGQEVAIDEADLAPLRSFFEKFGDEPFGPAAPVPDGASPSDRIIAATGRDPSWTPASDG